MTIPFDIAREISEAITSRSVADNMIDVTIHRRPYVHDDFQFWAKQHVLASNRLIALGIDVVTFSQEMLQ
jgi:hypothetical protein